MKFISTTIIITLFLSQSLLSQSLYSTYKDSILAADTGFVPDQALVEEMNPRLPLWVPLLESVGLNLALGAFNAYVMNSEFAKISFKSIEHNFERGWSTDADELTTNMFAHPFSLFQSDYFL